VHEMACRLEQGMASERTYAVDKLMQEQFRPLRDQLDHETKLGIDHLPIQLEDVCCAPYAAMSLAYLIRR